MRKSNQNACPKVSHIRVDIIGFYKMDQNDLFTVVFIVSLSNKMLSRMRMSLCLILSLTWATN